MRELLARYCVTMRGLLAVAALCLLGGVAAAQTQTFAKPGDGGTIEFPVENDSTSGFDATGVQLSIRIVPAALADRIQVNSITIKEDGSAQPTTVAIGQTRTFVVNYTITQAAQDGDSFQVFLDASIPDNIVLPDPSTWGTNVSFTIERTTPAVGVKETDGTFLGQAGGGSVNVPSGAAFVITATGAASGIASVAVYGPTGALISSTTLNGQNPADFGPFSGLADGSYSAVVQTVAGNSTTLGFSVVASQQLYVVGPADAVPVSVDMTGYSGMSVGNFVSGRIAAEADKNCPSDDCLVTCGGTSCSPAATGPWVNLFSGDAHGSLGGLTLNADGLIASGQVNFNGSNYTADAFTKAGVNIFVQASPDTTFDVTVTAAFTTSAHNGTVSGYFSDKCLAQPLSLQPPGLSRTVTCRLSPDPKTTKVTSQGTFYLLDTGGITPDAQVRTPAYTYIGHEDASYQGSITWVLQAVAPQGAEVTVPNADNSAFVTSPLADISWTSFAMTLVQQLAAAAAHLVAALPSVRQLFASQAIAFTAPASVSMKVPATSPSGLAVDPTTLALYEFDGTQWSSGAITNQSVTRQLDGSWVVAGSVTVTGPMMAFFLQPDALPPRTTLSIGRPEFLGGSVFVTTSTPFSLSAIDDALMVGDGLGRGVAASYYAVDGGAYQLFGTSFTIPTEGAHTVKFYSLDVLGHAEVAQSTQVVVDVTAPGPPLALQANGSSPSPWSNTGVYALTITTPSDVSGAAFALAKACGVPQSNADGAPLLLSSSSPAFGDPCLAQGNNPLFIWLVDNLGNEDFNQSRSIDLRYDSLAPASTAVGPSTASAAFNVVFVSSDNGADGVPPTGSGIAATILWFRRDHGGDENFGAWQAVASSATTGATARSGGPASSTGAFAFDPTTYDSSSPDGAYQFYTQAVDAAGNYEAPPTAASVPKAQTFFDNSPPIISNIALPFISATSAQLSWTTDDLSTAVVYYGTSTAFGRRVVISTASRNVTATLDCHLLYPDAILYQIVATNLTGLQTSSPIGSFNTPAYVNVPTDIFGVVNPAQPITGQINNPAITSGTYSVDGQSGTLNLATTTSFQIPISTAVLSQGTLPFMLSIDGFVYDTSFIIDTATRSVHLVRLAMDAGGVLTSTQTTPGSSIADMTLGQPAQGPSTGQISSGYLSSTGGPGDAGSRLYLGYYAGIDPVAPGGITNLTVLPGPATGQALLTWTAPGNDAYAGQAMIYDLRVSTNPINEANFFQASAVAISTLPALAGTTQQTVVAGLQNGTSYYFALKTFDEVLNVAAISNLVSTATFALARSTDLTNGLPTVSLITSVPGITVTEVASTGTYPALALATSAAAAQGLMFAGGIYDINSPLNPLPGGGTIQFQFDPTGLDPTTQSELRIYHFNLSIDSWTLLADIPPAFGSDVLIAPVSSFSPYAVMLHDTLPPITTLSYQGGKQYLSPSGGFFISTATSISLSARDPPIGRFSGTGVRLTEYRVDSALGPFIPLNPSSSSIQFAPGLHTVDYNSIDYAGNVEAVRSAAVGVDAAPPSTTLGFIGGGQAAGPDAATFYVSSGALAAYSSTDPVVNGVASGVAFTQFQVDGGTFQIYTASTAVALASGTHTLAFQSQDNVGNLEPPHVASVWVDAAPPAASFTFPAPGAALNNQSPPITVSYSDPALAPGVPGSGVNPASVRVLVDNVDVSSQATITAAQVQLSATAVPDGVHLIIVTVADRVGNSTSTALIFTTNTTPPAVAVSTPMNGTYFRNQFPTLSAAYSDYRSGLSSGTVSLKLDGLPVSAALTLTGPLPGGPAVGSPLGWTTTSPLPDTVQGMGAASWNGYVYSLGGSDHQGWIKSVYYAKTNPDGSLGPWLQTTPLPFGMYQLRAAVWANTIYVVDPNGTQGVYYAHLNADGTLGAWNQATGTYALDVAADNGFLYAFAISGVNFAAIHADGSLGNWAATTPLPAGLFQFQTAVAQGTIQIYFPGGANGPNQPVTSTYYNVPDPVTGQLGPWQTATPLPVPIYQNVTLATDGNLYVLENYPQSPIVAFAPFRPDYSLGAWTNDPRYYLPIAMSGSGGAATAVNLYIIGGYDSHGQLLSTVYTTPLSAGIATLATASFTPAAPLSEGTHTVTASVIDTAGNLASTTTVFSIDLTAPVSTAAAGPPVFVSSAGLVYVGTSAPVALSAYDPIINGAASGVDRINVSVDSGPFSAYGSTFTFAEGIHSLLFSAVDKAGNAESTHALTLRADATPPVTALVSSGAVFTTQAAEGPRSYASSQTYFSLQAQDPVSSNVASGVAFTQFRTGTLVNYLTSPQFLSFNYAFQQFVSTFSLAEGIQRVDFQSQDNVGNLELLQSTTIFVDATPPRSVLYVGAPLFVDSTGTFYVRPVTTMTIAGVDPPLPQAEPPASTAPIAGSGVNHLEVAVDTTVFAVYAGPLIFAEGLHSMLFRSVDNVGNTEPVNRLSVTSDNTPPVTALSPSGTFYVATAPEGTRYYAPGVFSYGLSAVDPLVNGAASGVASTWYRTGSLTNFPSSPTFNGGSFQLFSSTFGLTEGISRIDFQSQDNVLNLELLKTTTIFVDATPPVSSATIGSPQFTAADGTIYVASTTLVTFSAADPALSGSSGSVAGSGVNHIEVAIDSGAFAVYAATLTFAEGQHTILYRSVDNVGNVEAAHTLAIRIDATPPVTSIALSTPNYNQGAGQPAFVSAATILSLSAFDPVVNGVAAGVALTRYQVSGSSFAAAPLAFSLSGPDGTYAVSYQSVDNVGNTEILRSTTVLLDQTPPVTTAHVGASSFTATDGSLYVTPATPIMFTAVDPSSGGAASGVNHIEAAIDGGTFAVYAATLTLAEGQHTILYRAVDNVGNVEVTHTLTLRSDGTPPVTAVAVGSPTYSAADGTVYVTPATPIAFSAADPALPMGQPGSGVNQIDISIDSGPFTIYTSSLALAEGSHTILYRSLDNVSNTEAMHTLSLKSDATPPVTSIALSSPSFSPGAGQPSFISTATLLTLSAFDPVVNGVASGVALTSYRINGGAFVVAPLAFGLSGPDGTYTISYQSVDNVGNTEVLRSTTVLLDQTPPVTTAHVGASSFTAADGSLYVTPTTPLTFTTVDPSSGGVASGVNHIETAVDGGTFAVYAASLTFAEGQHAILYRAVDNVGNVEAAHTLTLRSDGTPPVTMVAVGSPTYASGDGTVYVTPATPLSFTAADSSLSSGQPGSGVNQINVSIDSGPFTMVASSLTFAEGPHTIQYRSLDDVGNAEAIHILSLKSDATPPVTMIAASTPSFADYVSGATILSLSAVDPISHGVAAGVKATYVAVGSAAFAPAVSGFSLAVPDGAKTISFYSQDNVLNTEAIKSTTVLLDATPPQTTLAILGGRQYPVPSASGFYASSTTLLALVAIDPVVNGVASGVAFTQYQDCGSGTAPCGSSFQVFGSAFGLSEGEHNIGYQSQDRVQNLEVTHSTTVLIDATPPVTTVLVGTPTYTSPGGTVYVAPASPITFSAADPNLPTGQPGSGVYQIDISIDSGPFVAYSSSVYLAEGAHAIAYRSVDNVGNAEATRTLQLQSDATPPVTTIALSTPNYSQGAGQPAFVSAATVLTLSSFDPVVNGVASGVALTRYQLNGGPFASVPSTFGLSGLDGTYTIAYQSVDNVGNTEVLRSTTVLLDQTPPVTTAHIGASSFTASDGSLYVTPATPITFTAVDPSSGGVASGVNHLEAAIDGGTFTVYAATLTFAEGQHTILYRAVDNVGNVETAHTLTLRSDATPPVTAVAVGSPTYTAADGTVYVTPATPIAFSAADPALPTGQPGSGVRELDVSIDSGPFSAYISSITLPEGSHTVAYRSVDNVGNAETVRTLAFKSDATPPISAIAISSPSVGNYVSTTTVFNVSALDPVSHGVASGVKATYVAVGGGAFSAGVSSFTLSVPDGPKLISFYSQDNVLNTETVKSTTVLLDATPPQTALAILGGRQYPVPAASGFYASSATLLAFVATDPIVNGVASGVAFTQYQDCGSAAAPCGSPFQVFGAAFGLSEGAHNIGYQSQDRVQNLEVIRSSTVLVDATPPVTTVLVGSPTYTSAGGTVYVAPASPITFSVVDPNLLTGQSGSGVNQIDVSIDGGPFVAYSSAVYLAEGRHTIAYRSVDNVGNAEAGRTIQLQSDATPPVTTIAIGAPQLPLTGGITAISTLTALGFQAADPVVNGVASGVRQTQYSVAGGPYSVFTASFTPAPTGAPEAIGFFSQDNVANTEATKIATVLVDTVAPTIVIGSPVAGATYVANQSTIAIRFSVIDPYDAAPSSVALLSEILHLQGPVSGSTSAVVANGQNLSPLSLDQGIWQFSVAATNALGLSTTVVTGSFKVIHDIEPPRTTLAVGTPQAPGGPQGSVFVSSRTAFTLSSIDDLVAVGDGIGLGTAFQELIIDTSTPVTFQNPSPQAGQVFASTFSLSTEGLHYLEYFAQDVVGNREAVRAATAAVDNTPPITALSIGSPQFALSSSTVLVSSRTPFSITAVDPVVNGVASGVRQSFYRINNSSFTAYSVPFALSSLSAGVVPPDGPQSIFFYSQDNVLNAETVKAAVVSLDATAPQAAILSPSAAGSGICRVLKGVFHVLGSALDAHLASYVLDFAPGQNATSGFTLISSATFGTSSPGFGTTLVGVSSGTVGVWNASALSGWQTLRLTATDLVQNATVVTVNVYVGDPAELLVLGNHTLFNMPRGVAVDSGRDIYVADTNDNQIKEFTSTGTFLAAFGQGDGHAHSRNFDPDDNPTSSTAALRLNKPKGVAVDAGGNIYIADTNNDRVLELSATGQVLLELGKHSVDGGGREHFKPGSQPGEFNAPSAVAIGANGNIYVADTENRRVQVFSSTGGVALVVYMPALTPFCTGPGGAAPCAPPGNDDDSGEDGYPPGPGVGNLGRPEGIAVDLAGNIYVADPQGSRALKFDPTGKFLLTIPILGQPGSQNAGGGGSGSSGPLVQSEPNGIAVSPSGDCILVSDRKFARVLKFDALGNQLLSFGTQGKIPDNQAPPSGIVFQKPIGLALDNLGNLYVADRNNDRLEEFGLPTGNPTLVVPPPVSDPNAARDVVASADGGAVSRQDGASVQVPPGALSQDLKITVSTATDQDALQISLASKKAGDKGLQVAYAPISFSPEGTQFSQAVTLVMPYTPDLLLAEGITEDQLAIDYWNPAKSDWEALPSVVDKINHIVTARTTHFSLYQVLSGTAAVRALAAPQPAADPTFMFRDLYAFPNPAIRGKSPTIRLQVGVADSVELHIYDISGKLVHQAGITAPPQPFDDGNGKGAQYTYDFPWDVSGVGSGVYIYSVTAKKAGQTDIRRIKKLGVVR